MLQAIKYRNGHLEILDQLQLPHVCSYLPVKDTDAGWEVIRSMKVRGAPAIAIVGALSLASELHEDKAPWTSKQELSSHVAERLAHLETSRPTAVNLANMANELRALAAWLEKDNSVSLQDMKHRLADEAEKMLADDLSANKAMGRHGAEHLLAHCKPPRGATGLGVLTHCNTGSLATAGHGTALGVIRSLHEMGRLGRAYCTETRPYNQGSRLTAFELVHDGIPATLVCDSMVAALMARGEVSAVVVGADRIVANGDTANKVGHAGMASKRATCVRALTGEEIQELLMNSDSDECENDDAAQLSALSSDDSEEEPVPLKKNTRQGRDKIFACSGTRRSFCVPPAIDPPAIEEAVKKWVQEQQDKSLSVSYEDIEGKARAVTNEIDIDRSDFKISKKWVANFMKRPDLSLRKRTTICQRLPDACKEKLSSFHRYVADWRTKNEFMLGQIGNADQTLVWLDMPSSRIVMEEGARQVHLLTTGNEDNRFTTMLCCTADGHKLPPFLIFKCK
ncbi:hypothetical protein HPB47_025253 [Ixodes persulcatus]|uniref:Uncharacterized protein n=1 Tax=Ixodes persulcatus TaxID=34615 RepID=A0AC60Q3U9_IXOPE|nr:hypothetical protein HPB47_025253 [Ixodes persulcatus]